MRALSRHRSLPPCPQDGLPPAERSGALWRLYNHLVARGWIIDARGYETSFRVRFPQPHSKAAEGGSLVASGSPAEARTREALEAILEATSQEVNSGPVLAWATNLGRQSKIVLFPLLDIS